MFSNLHLQPLPIDLLQLFMAWSAILFASVLRSFTGFGFALAAVPVFSMFLSPIHSIILCALLSLAIGLTTLPTYWNRSCFSTVLPLIAMSMITTPLGAFLLTSVSVKRFKILIGLTIIISSALLCLYSPQPQSKNTKRRKINAILAGFFSGLLNGAFAIPGPPVILYTMALEPEPIRSRSMMIMFFTFSSALVVVTYGARGYLDFQSFSLFLLSFPVMIAGDTIGFRLLHRFGTSFYRRISLITLFSIGFFSLAQALLLNN